MKSSRAIRTKATVATVAQPVRAPAYSVIAEREKDVLFHLLEGMGADPEKVKSLLGLPAHVRIPALVSVGYPAEEGFRPHRLPSESLVQFR